MSVTQRVGLDQFATLTSFQRDVLWTLARADAPIYGLRIKERLEEHYGEVNHGRLYPNLDTLVEEGLVEKRQRDQRTNEYVLTDAASQLLAARQAWERGEE